MGYIEDGCRYIKNDVEIGVYSGRLDERDSILVIQRNYYDYSGLKEQKDDLCPLCSVSQE